MGSVFGAVGVAGASDENETTRPFRRMHQRNAPPWKRDGGDRGLCRRLGRGKIAEMKRPLTSGFFFLCLTVSAWAAGGGFAPCRIEVVEEGTCWPVPLVEMRTTHGVRMVTDNAGIAAFDLPEWMGKEVWLEINGHGYGREADGFGQRGVRVTPVPGGKLRIEVKRWCLARRIGRLTGAGFFADSVQCGSMREDPDSGVAGCDSVQVAAYRNRLFWLWGDTSVARYPLGIFHTTGAWTDATPIAKAEPPLRMSYEIFRDEAGRPRAIAELPGEGPTWLSALAALKDREGKERLVATYMKVKPPLEAWQRGLCMWDDEAGSFRSTRVLWTKSAENPKEPPMPDGHAVKWRDEKGVEQIGFGNPFPTIRCRATLEAWADPAAWETLEAPRELAVAGGGGKIKVHTGSMAWNGHRKRWIAVFVEIGGKPSMLGEVWYAEAPSPTGPWSKVVKILTHDNQTYYNPRLHPELTAEDAPFVLFEGTFTKTFANHAEAVPRYDYNQVLYRLDLQDVVAAMEGKGGGR